MEKQLRRSSRNKISANVTPISNEKEESVEPVEAEEETTELNHLNSPLHNPLILNHIFNHLELEDLKQCNLVCIKWNGICISFLEKMSIVTLSLGRGLTCTTSPEAFLEFSKTANIQFRAFKLGGYMKFGRMWTPKRIIDFCQDRRETMEELVIDKIHVYSHHDYFDISRHIGNHLTHLSISNDNGSKFIVDTNNLASLKSIFLDQCALEVSEGCVLSPQKFELKDVKLFKKRKIVHDVLLINELLNFETLQDLSLDGPSIQLDLNGKVTLNNLSLKHLTLKNLNDSQWEIKGKLKMCCVSFDTWTRMKFTELDFRHASINLDLLPESLEKLTLSEGDCDEPLRIVRPSLFSRPNLSYFQLLIKYNRFIFEYEEMEDDDNSESDESIDDNCGNDEDRNVDKDEEERSNVENVENNSDSENDEENSDEENVEENSEDEEDPYDPPANRLWYLNYFAHCPSLTTVRVKLEGIGKFGVGKRLQTEWIPKSTENLFLSGNIRAKGEELQFNKLVIEDNNLYFLTNTLKRMKSKHIVLDLDSVSDEVFSNISKLQLEKIGNIRATEEFQFNKPDNENNNLQILTSMLNRLKSKHVLDFEFIEKFSKTSKLHVEKILVKLIKTYPYESLTIGSLEMAKSALNKSSFSNDGYERTGPYLFTSQDSKPIKEWEFKKMLGK